MTSSWCSKGLLAEAVFTGGLKTAQAEVNIYSARTEALIKPVLDQFTAQTGIKVNLVSGRDDELISRLRTESSKSPADLFLQSIINRLGL
jgi:iron(III) transport system substrate-binding protein